MRYGALSAARKRPASASTAAEDCGDAYTFLAIERDTKLILA